MICRLIYYKYNKLRPINKELFIVYIVVTSAFAQTYKYYSTDFAYKAKNDYGYWTEWSDWEESHCLITISLDRGVVNIYSPIPQEFDTYDDLGERYDNDGKSYTLCGVDSNGLRCTTSAPL